MRGLLPGLLAALCLGALTSAPLVAAPVVRGAVAKETVAAGAEGCAGALPGFLCAAPAALRPAPSRGGTPVAARGLPLHAAAAQREDPGGTGGPGRPVRFSVEVQAATGLDPEAVGREIAAILRDPRGWQAEQRVRFVPAAPEAAQIRFVLASPARVDRMCLPLRTLGYLSCRQGRFVVMNAARWHGAMPHWDGALHDYRAYLVNHETGHALGHRHRACPSFGALAPVMMQQTKSLRGCRGNGWPFPAPRALSQGLRHLRLQ